MLDGEFKSSALKWIFFRSHSLLKKLMPILDKALSDADGGRLPAPTC